MRLYLPSLTTVRSLGDRPKGFSPVHLTRFRPPASREAFRFFSCFFFFLLAALKLVEVVFRPPFRAISPGANLSLTCKFLSCK